MHVRVCVYVCKIVFLRTHRHAHTYTYTHTHTKAHKHIDVYQYMLMLHRGTRYTVAPELRTLSSSSHSQTQLHSANYDPLDTPHVAVCCGALQCVAVCKCVAVCWCVAVCCVPY